MSAFKKGIAAILLAFSLILPAASAHAGRGFSATVSRCIDGDTVALANGQRVRLAGVDTPEKGSDGNPPQYFALEASGFTCQKVTGQEIRVVPLPGKIQDRYGRLVAEIILPDGQSLNEWLLREGMASFYSHKDLPEKLVRRLLAAQNEAIAARRGCWGYVLTLPLAGESFTGNTNSKRFYSEECLRKSHFSDQHQIHFPNLETAFKEGYAPVRACNIWPSAK